VGVGPVSLPMTTTPKKNVPVPPPGKRLLTPAEVGASIGRGEQHVRDLIKARQLRAVKVERA
jgi:hypothetical protein